MAVPPLVYSLGVSDAEESALTGTVAYRKLAVAQDLREHSVLVCWPHKRGWLEPHIGVTDKLEVLRVEEVGFAIRAVAVEDNGRTLEQQVLEPSV